ncbi:MAG: hypothetical protein ABSH41_29700 [Syntrophobacteraceae bacterium]
MKPANLFVAFVAPVGPGEDQALTSAGSVVVCRFCAVKSTITLRDDNSCVQACDRVRIVLGAAFSRNILDPRAKVFPETTVTR